MAPGFLQWPRACARATAAASQPLSPGSQGAGGPADVGPSRVFEGALTAPSLMPTLHSAASSASPCSETLLPGPCPQLREQPDCALSGCGLDPEPRSPLSYGRCPHPQWTVLDRVLALDASPGPALPADAVAARPDTPGPRGLRACVPGESPQASAFRVQVGQLRLYDPDRLMKVTEIIPHPNYDHLLSANGGAGIALLRLESPMTLFSRVRMVSLPPASLRVPERKMCWVTGWGDIRLGDKLGLPPPHHLQEAEVPIVGNEVCNRHYQSSSTDAAHIIKDDMLCAGSEGRDSCQGDSGGPLVCGWNRTWVQVGVVSWGDVCGHRNFPGVYTRVTSYVSWIRQYVRPPRP
ncbi:mastin-like [Odocoileus virginianus]|uniref:Mastin-like n=1 Tax=Odocoileus virginianus TaxID=9874 RepID=A0ABM4HNP2_ODOVR